MSFGIDRLVSEIAASGYESVQKTQVTPAGSTEVLYFAVVPDYEVQVGRFAGRVIGLGVPAPADFPRSVGASVHVLADPQLLEIEHVLNVRNIIASQLGPDWRYWSHNFNWGGEREKSAARLLKQINAIFDRA
jgi:hypothetical protein